MEIIRIMEEGSSTKLEKTECFQHDPMPDAAGEGFPSTITLEKEASCVVVGDDPHFSYLKLIKVSHILVTFSYFMIPLLTSVRRPTFSLILTADSSSQTKMRLCPMIRTSFLVSVSAETLLYYCTVVCVLTWIKTTFWGTGCFAAALRTAVLPREPVLFGKPGEPMGRYLKNNLELNPEKTIMFGDRWDLSVHLNDFN